IRKFINKPNQEIFKEFEANGYKKYAVLDTFNSDTARRYNFPTEETYEALKNIYKIDEMDGFLEYKKAREIFDCYEKCRPSVFNLWKGAKYKSNILRYKKDYDGYHPTQKPVALPDDLIRTYSNEGDLIVDLTMGSGSTGVAAVKAGRRFTGIELSDEYFDIAERRISESLT